MKIKEIKEKIKIGIDKIGFAMPKYFLDIRDLALGRNENENKFVKGLMQSEMSISPVTEDIVSLGASAAAQILDEEDKKNIDNRYTLAIYIDDEQLEKIGLENYQDYLINWISIAYLRMLIKIHDFLINYYNLTLEKGLKIDDVMLVLIDILDTEVKDFPKGLKKSIEVGKETAGKCFFINKVIQPVPLTPELTLLLQGKDAYNIVPKI